MTTMTTARRIASDLRTKIQNGEYLPGHQLPTGGMLMETYGVASQTVRDAISLLRGWGLVTCRQGSGCFVSEPKMKYFASLTGSQAKRLEGAGQIDTFAQQLGPQGLRTQQVCTVEELPADVEIATRLRIETGDPVVARRRVMSAGTSLSRLSPVQLGDSYYPLEIVDGSKLMNPEGVVEGDDQVLVDNGHEPTRYEDEITARTPTDDEVTVLNMDPSVSVIQLIRTTFDQNNQAIEVYVVILPSDRHVLMYGVSAA